MVNISEGFQKKSNPPWFMSDNHFVSSNFIGKFLSCNKLVQLNVMFSVLGKPSLSLVSQLSKNRKWINI